ncbi:MAG TPA: DegT/DnrJ/EryC1/StrS family aminotransferase [bacterium]|nr:DegT/DnrJ/EryC1/StrS family aminotransferase [bacterium]HOL35465.1 DegT/DnrJ/EryC1/StrS family aminotransferase [bacterium]HPP08863.1 DegT/DnrJ/EryC1/StrS family aminotransferase [bacterium]HXK44642.1 DegT/DnrJ/EryC1/StrS family aminotransferase [bacterium]
MTIPMLDLGREYEYMRNDIDQAIRKCLEHQKWILGPEVGELEKKISNYLGVKHCVGVSSGTDALVLGLRALALKIKGKEFFDRTDEIITTPFTFTATGDAILRSGAIPVFVDIDPQTFNIDTGKIAEYLENQGDKVVGILPVHLYGLACDMDKIMGLAEKNKIFVLEDVAQASGGAWKNRKLGSIGNVGAFSFFPSKNLGGFGDGGMVATDDDEIADIVRILLKHGGKDKYNVDYLGYNARLDTIQAAVLVAKFKYLDQFNEKRRMIAEFYNENLKEIGHIITPEITPDAYHVYHQYTIRVKNGKRDGLQNYLKEKGIATMIYYPVCLHRMKLFEGRSKSFKTLINADNITSEVLSLPIEPLMKNEELQYIVSEIKNYFSTKD